MLPPRTTGCRGSGGEDRGGQRRTVVVLPFVPVTPIVGAGHRRRNRSASRDERRDAPVALDARLDERPEGGAQARLGRRVVGRDRRRGRHEIGRRPRSSRGSTSGPSASVTGRSPSAAIASASSSAQSAVVDRHPRAGVGQEARQRDPAAGQAEDRDRSVAERARADGVEREAVEVDRAVASSPASPTAGPRTRGRASRRAARRGSPTIQNRIVIFSSSQPPSSKWWWIGLIRKRRWPPDSLK